MNKNVLKFMVFIMLLNIITPLFNKNEALAARDISSTNVTDLTVSPTKIEDGGKTTVKMTFDDKSVKIQNGDTIKVAWPTSGTVKIEGYSKTVPLTVKGEQVGQAVITPDGATITFNDKVEKLSDVSGFAEFEVQGRNLTQTNTSDDKVATITSGNKSTNVTVHKSEAGTSSVFYYKTGDMLPEDTTHVRWFLNINNEKRYVSKDITIKDQIQGGQQLDLSTLNINVTGTHSNYYSGSNAITDFEKAFPGSKITVDNTKNTIDVTIPQGYGSYNSFSINYKTKITNEQQKEFVNNSQAWYQEHGKEEVNGKSFNHTVHNINANAGIEGTVKGELKVLKQDKDTKAPIANVKFKLSKKDGSVVKDNQKEIEIITDANGIANIKALPSGDYILKEKVKGYTTHVDNNDMGNLIVTNKYTPETTSINGEKVWDDKDNQDGKRPEKVSINLLANGEKVKTLDVTSETNWKYEFKDLPKYDEGKKIEYTVTEDHVKDYTTDINGTTITNKYTPGETSATVTKNWDDNNNQDGKRPTEIKVELYQDGKATGKTATLNESNNWTHTWAGLDEKAKGQQVKYTVEELTKVKGYTTHVDNNDMGNLIVTNKYTPEKPNKPIYPEKPKDKTPPTKPDHSNKVKPTPPDKPSKVDKDDQPKDNKTKPENPLKELPKTGMKIITSWITWVFIGILGLYLILRKRFNS